MPTTPVANLKIKLDGEKEYKAAVSEINATLRRLDSELKKTDAQFADNADSIEALSQKHGTLSEKVTAQEKKVDELRKAFSKAEEIQKAANKSFEETASTLDKSSDEYAEMVEQLRKANMQADKWATSLNNAEAELAKMQGTLDENTAALESAKNATEQLADATDNVGGAASSVQQPLSLASALLGENKLSAKGLGDALTDVAGQFGIQLPEGAAKAAEALNGINAGAALAVTGVGLLAAAIVKAEKKLIEMTKESAESAKEIKRLSSVTGQSTKDVQAYSYAANQLGITYDKISDALKETTNKMQEARDGNEETAAAYRKLGVSITDLDGNLRDADDVFRDTIDALAKVENHTDRDAIAMDLLSESARDLNPLIEAGTGTLDAYAKAAKDAGMVMTTDEIEALEAVDQKFKVLQGTQESVKNHLSADFAPYLSEFYDDLNLATKELGDELERSGVVKAFGELLGIIGDIIAPTDDFTNNSLPPLELALRGVALTVAAIADSLRAIWGLADGIANGIDTGDWTMLEDAFSFSTIKGLMNAWDSSSTMQRGGFGGSSSSGGGFGNGNNSKRRGGSLKGNLIAMNASGTDNFLGGLTWVGENGPEPVWLPRGTVIGTNQDGRNLSGGDNYYFIVQANEIREINEFIQRFKDQRLRERMEGS